MTLTQPGRRRAAEQPDAVARGSRGQRGGRLRATSRCRIYAGAARERHAAPDAERDALRRIVVDAARRLGGRRPTRLARTRPTVPATPANPRRAPSTVDATPPAVTLTSPAAGSVGGPTPTFAGAAGTAAGDASTITVRVYGGTSATGTPVQVAPGPGGGRVLVGYGRCAAGRRHLHRARRAGRRAPATPASATRTDVRRRHAPPPPPVDYRAAVMSDAPRAYWRLGETSGLVAADQTSNGISGSYLNGVVLGRPGAVAGDPNTAVALDGSQRHGPGAPTPSPLNSCGAMSLEAWIRPTVAARRRRPPSPARKASTCCGCRAAERSRSGCGRAAAINEAVTPGGAVGAGAGRTWWRRGTAPRCAST